ncbi:MAG: carboxymuconolactone decarboxylase family protein [Ilumatobacteraceae bacterium]
MTTNRSEGTDRGAPASAESRLRELATTAGTTQCPVLNGPLRASGLDDRTDALVRLAALIASGAPSTAYRRPVDAAHAGGATDDEIIGTMIAVASTVGLSRVIAATAGLGLGLRYDIESALERLDGPSPAPVPPADG